MIGSLLKNKAYSGLLDYLCNYEKKLNGNLELTKFDKLHDAFYKGDIANTIIKHSNERNGLLAKQDFDNFDINLKRHF
jgi:gamma-glutamyltranspeptidase